MPKLARARLVSFILAVCCLLSVSLMRSDVATYAEGEGPTLTYTVTYHGNGNTGGTAPVDGNNPYNAAEWVGVAGPGDLVKTGLTFGGWNTAADGGGTHYNPAQVFAINADTTLYAQWIVEPCFMGDSLDPLFDGDGKVTTDIGGSPDEALAVAIQSDGKIVAAGYSTWDFALVRYNADGSLDTTFGTDGKVTTDFSGSEDRVFSVALQSDGKIVAAGFSHSTSAYLFALARYNADGSLDTTFDADGKVTTDVLSSYGDARSIVIQPDGKIVAAGYSDTGGVHKDFALVRYNPDGSLDTTFDTDGKVVTAVLSSHDYAESVAIQPDGKIVAAGESYNGMNYDISLVRYNPNGLLDTTFDMDGKVTTAVGSSDNYASSVAIQPDGKIVAAGGSSNGSNKDFALVRYNVDGSLDTNFDTDGKVATDVLSSNESAESVAIQPDGRIVAAGFSSNGSNDDLAIVRYNADGSLDTTFGTGGKVTTAIGSASEEARSVAIQADGRIVAAGGSYNGLNNDFALVRYGGTRAPFDYDADGKADLTVRRPSNNIWYLLQGTAGFTAIQWGVAGDRLAPADYDGDGKTDIAIFRPSEGKWYIYMSQSGTFQTFGWGTDGDLPVPTDRNNDGKSELVVYRESNGTWYAYSTATGPYSTTQFGEAGDKPLVGDFDGDGKGDNAVFRPSNSTWYILLSGGGGYIIRTWGQTEDIQTPADFDGDGKTDLAIFRPSTGQWYRMQSTAGIDVINWGQAGDIPVAADYDGDGKADAAVFRPSNGKWYLRESSAGFLTLPFGQDGDTPTPSAFIY